jgi:tetratricopeptide (TPR) repeat protein
LIHHSDFGIRHWAFGKAVWRAEATLVTMTHIVHDGPSGEMVMRFSEIGRISGITAVMVFALAVFATPGRSADDDAALRDRALALNDVTGDKTIKGEIKKLLGDPKGTKKLLDVAVRMAKEKEQPFSYNAALIFADVAYAFRDYESSHVFFRVCADQAISLDSTQKLVNALGGLDNVGRALYRVHKYEQSAKVAQELLELGERIHATDAFKGEQLKLQIQSLKKEGKADQARRMIQTLRKARPNDWRALRLEAWFEDDDKHTDQAIKLYNDALQRLEKDEAISKREKTEDLAETRQELVDLFYRAKRWEECRKLARQGLESLGTDDESAGRETAARRFFFLQRLGLSLVRLKKSDEAIQAVDAQKKRDDQWELQDLKGRLYREADRFQESAKTYEDLLARIGKEEKLTPEAKNELQAEVRYLLSGVYVDMNQVDKAAKELETLLAKDPDNATYNNDLGYIWADHDQNLDKAEKMIRKAIDEDRKQRKTRPGTQGTENKDNAAYLDSLGWILYKKKQFPEAKKYLLEAVKDEDGQHIEIMDHLGEIYKALGEKKEAVATWKKALDLKPDFESKRDRDRRVEVEKKIKQNQ